MFAPACRLRSLLVSNRKNFYKCRSPKKDMSLVCCLNSSAAADIGHWPSVTERSSRYFLHASFMLVSRGVNLKSGSVCSNLSFSNVVLLCATFALSFVSTGDCPVKTAFSFSQRHAIPINDGVVCLDGFDLPKPSAIVSSSCLNVQLSPVTIKRCSVMADSIIITVAFATSSTATKPFLPGLYQLNPL